MSGQFLVLEEIVRLDELGEDDAEQFTLTFVLKSCNFACRVRKGFETLFSFEDGPPSLPLSLLRIRPSLAIRLGAFLTSALGRKASRIIIRYSFR